MRNVRFFGLYDFYGFSAVKPTFVIIKSAILNSINLFLVERSTNQSVTFLRNNLIGSLQT